MNTPSPVYDRQSALIQMNAGWLRQAQRILGQSDDSLLVANPPGLGLWRIGGHIRHIIEFYECFLDGLECGHIDYDSRRRDEILERSCAAASQRIGAIIERLETDSALRGDAVVFVRVEDAAAFDLDDPYLISSVGRELLALSSHTVHHFALVAVALRAFGIEPGAEFGVAPSTLRYQAAVKKEAA
jgi:hypothetical protein